MIEATVRYGYMMFINSFLSDLPLRPGDKVIVSTDRGIELGEVVTLSEQVASSDEIETLPTVQPEPAQPDPDKTGQQAADNAGANDKPSEGTGEETTPVEKKVPPVTEQQRPVRGPRVLRKATKNDIAKSQDIYESIEPAQLKFCQQKIRELSVPMRLAAVERLFGGEKIIFYFLAESRVDFRALVRELAREYRTRIEMKQIGARDEAKLLGDYEHCGRELCCRKFIRALEPVTIKMAKSQKATLDPSKISGACGRLMCCLRFENPIYIQLKRQLPRKGKKVKTPKGEGEVINYDIIAQTVFVEESTGEKVTYKLEEISWDRKEREPAGKSSKGRRDSERTPGQAENSQKTADTAPSEGSGTAGDRQHESDTQNQPDKEEESV
jgi:cell fate regulator YaaT (PSP1 superfamily)